MPIPLMRAGTEVIFRVKVYDQLPDPPVLATPSEGVTMTLYAPDGSPVGTFEMTEASTGVFTAAYQTETDSPTGAWTMTYTAVNDNGDSVSTVMTVVQEAFVLIA